MTPMDYVQEFDDHPMGVYLLPEQREMLAGIIAKAQAEAVQKKDAQIRAMDAGMDGLKRQLEIADEKILSLIFAVEEEREACARILKKKATECETGPMKPAHYFEQAIKLIRARGENAVTPPPPQTT